MLFGINQVVIEDREEVYTTEDIDSMYMSPRWADNEEWDEEDGEDARAHEGELPDGGAHGRRRIHEASG